MPQLRLSFLALLSFIGVSGYSQSTYGTGYCGQNGRFLELTSLLQGISYLGHSERIEIEISGGNYASYGQHTYLIEARGGLEVEAYQTGGNVDSYSLKIYDSGNATNSSDKYKIGILISTGWACIDVRARLIPTNVWVDIQSLSLSQLPTLPEVDFTTKWLFKSRPSLFEVEGTIRSKEVKVEASPWPDYVFAEDYDLASLEETADFINENHRLPNMPSAEEVEQEGVLLGSMNAKLLEKIEELTLHVIELDRKNREQDALINELLNTDK